MNKLIGLDFETVLKDKIHSFFSFQLYSDDFKGMRVFSTYAPEFQDYLTAKYDRVWFIVYNLAFDGCVLSRILKDSGFTCSMFLSGSRIISMTVRKGDLKFSVKDLRNILPSKGLADLGEKLQVEKYDKPEYLGQRGFETNEEEYKFKRYAMRDAEICYKGAKRVFDTFNTKASTCAGLAMRIFKRDYCHIKKFPHYEDSVNEKLRLSYRGGRTECFIRGTNIEKLIEYDINSLYPYVMKQYDYPFVCYDFYHKTSMNLDNEGIAHVKVKVEHDFPPLGIRYKCADGFQKLVFPNGRFDGWFTYPELRTLEANDIGTILDIYETYEWKRKFNPFIKYVSDFYRLRQRDNANSMLYKIMLNSLYGKFGEQGHGRIILLEDGMKVSESETTMRKRWYHSVPIASYITAYARLELWKILKNLKPHKVYYCDTDSIHTSHILAHKVGSALGKLKIEDTALKGHAIYVRGKFYCFNDKLVLKGFEQDIDRINFIFMLHSNDFKIVQHRILKFLEAERIKKVPLYDMKFYKKVEVAPDMKRVYLRKVKSQDLFAETVYSKPLTIKA